ncbi:MAG: thioredoxin fold domain-containing protein [Saprospiraceae bacterium]|nr:thioredoxin fold domain-containing protein [Saprospiraceae bacterium]
MIKLKYIFFLLCIILSMDIHAQGLSYFSHGLDSAKVEATYQNKYVLIEFYADWCINCKIMDEEIFSIQEIKFIIEDKCIPVKLDIKYFSSMDVADIYDVKVYPTLLVLESNGTLIHKIVGKKTYSELLVEFIDLPRHPSVTKF